jgi:membrane-associated phospholipid phosphatase
MAKRKPRLAARNIDVVGAVGARQIASMTAVACVVAAVRARKALGLPGAVSTACAYAAVPSLAAGFKRSALRDGLVWAAQMWAYKNAFEMPYDDKQRLRDRTHYDYPIAVDSRIGRGMPPGRRLQRRLRNRGELTSMDKVLSFLYWTWEAEPHLAIMWIRCRHPDRFASAAGRLATTFNLTLIAYWLVPTAPPWWVSEKLGRMDGDVRRVMVEVSKWLKREPNPTQGDHELGANPFAAMPSDHVASAAMTAICIGQESPLLGAIAWSYAITLAFALLYLGEHYLTDELAGLMLALAVNQAAKPIERIAQHLLSLAPGR